MEIVKEIVKIPLFVVAAPFLALITIALVLLLSFDRDIKTLKTGLRAQHE